MVHWVNYHSHCNFCDGKESPETYVKMAIEKHFKIYGFSSHGPVPFKSEWNMKKEVVHSYIKEIQSLKAKYQNQLEIYCGMEVDYIPGITGPLHDEILNLSLDYTIGSVHYAGQFDNGEYLEIDGSHEKFLNGVKLIFSNDIKSAVTHYFELTKRMIIDEPPSIIGHLDKIKIQNENGLLFSESEQWYQQEIDEILALIAEKGLIIEVNTRGIYKKKTNETYPSKWVLEKILHHKIPVILSSDAHHPSEIDKEFSSTALLLQKIGFKSIRILYKGAWKDIVFNENGIIWDK